MMRIVVIVILYFMCFSAKAQEEGIAIPFPEKYNWKILSEEANSQYNTIDLIPEKENENNWTLLVHMLSLKGMMADSLDEIMNFMYTEAQETSPCAEMSFIEQETNHDFPWIVFKIENSCVTPEDVNESQLWYIRQGEMSLYVNFIAIKGHNLSQNFVTEWTSVFKKSEIILVE
jgi:hypothetical protein